VVGNTSSVYYGSYVFFEKITIRDGKAKTKTRVEMEELYDGRKFLGRRGWILSIGVESIFNELGKKFFMGR